MTIMELIAFFSPDIIRNHREKEKKRMEHKSNVFLEQEKISVLMRKFAIPCIISLLIAALIISWIKSLLRMQHILAHTEMLQIMWYFR